jgi:hypothetical protein
MSSHKATTTARVEDRPDLDVYDLSDLFWQDWLDQGIPPEPELRTAAGFEAELMTRQAAALPVGTVVERVASGVRVRPDL